MNVLVISPDIALREQLEVSVRTVARRTGEPWETIEATNGIDGLKLAWKYLPDLVVADEIASGAGAFAVARDLTGAAHPFLGGIILILARAQDAWLAKWSGADAWLTKPVDPFRLAEMALEIASRKALRKETV